MMELDQDRLRQELAGCTLGRQLIVLATTSSTQDEGRRLARAGAPFGTVVIAAEQTAGRGRLNRAWWSPSLRGLWFTMLLDPAPGGLLPLVAGVAVADALRSFAGDAIRVKWPNDVLLNGRKVAGILVEVDPGPPRPAALLGIGVNVNIPPELARSGEPGAMASLHEVAGTPPQLEPVFGSVVRQLESCLRRAKDSSADVVRRWRELSTTLGTRVRVVLPSETLEGLAEDIDDAGALRIRCNDGSARQIVAGDVLSAH
jgi:BirA family biotin operon repressor/biotin-[acetyl-CoA-carboxylase] ligase